MHDFKYVTQNEFNTGDGSVCCQTTGDFYDDYVIKHLNI